MELKQRIEIPAALQEVWQALNDPEILKACLTGCKRFEPIAENRHAIELHARVGPVQARFNGEVELTEINEPYSYTISGVGKGGVAGFARGSAKVRLTQLESEGQPVTEMVYQVDASVGGKLAQIGSRLVLGAARKMANDFFRQFVLRVSGDNVARDEKGEVNIVIETIEQ